MSVIPVTGIVLLLCFTITPIPNGTLMAFVMGAVLLILGMGFFTLGAEIAMTPMGEAVGSHMTRTKKLWVVIAVSLFVGIMITISEPDLQVLAEQVPNIPNMTLILCVAVGVGLFSGFGDASNSVPDSAFLFADRILCCDFFNCRICFAGIYCCFL